jgi:hypothetical protein
MEASFLFLGTGYDTNARIVSLGQANKEEGTLLLTSSSYSSSSSSSLRTTHPKQWTHLEIQTQTPQPTMCSALG